MKNKSQIIDAHHAFEQQLRADAGYAQDFHNLIADACIGRGVFQETAHQIARDFMKSTFDVDTGDPFWNVHAGGECPVHPNLMNKRVAVKMRGGETRVDMPAGIVWKHLDKDGDVLMWRFLPQNERGEAMGLNPDYSPGNKEYRSESDDVIGGKFRAKRILDFDERKG